MKNVQRLMLMLISALFAFQPVEAQEEYSGTKLCASCHKGGKGGTSYTVWAASAHAKAFKTLKSDAAKKIAAEKGVEGAPHENAACLSCHVTGGGTAKNVAASFKIDEGITCEACHGPSSGYKMLHSKGDREKSIAAGLIPGDMSGESCKTCHNEKSPTFKGFDFKTMWAKIQHPMPEKK